MSEKTVKRCIPFVLTVIVLVLDQLTKYLVTSRIPLFSIGASFFGDIIRIIHVTNPGIAFSVGDSLPQTVRNILFSGLPLIVLTLVIVIYFRNTDFSTLQRWCICGVLGGGFGNLYDRMFRAEGVIDFIDVKFWGIFGLPRWPTFNVADMAIVICGIILVISFLITVRSQQEEPN